MIFHFIQKKIKYLDIRNILLGENKYFEIMNSMMKKSKVSLNTFKLHKKLWMSTIELQKLKNDGHIIGLYIHFIK